MVKNFDWNLKLTLELGKYYYPRKEIILLWLAVGLDYYEDPLIMRVIFSEVERSRTFKLAVHPFSLRLRLRPFYFTLRKAIDELTYKEIYSKGEEFPEELYRHNPNISIKEVDEVYNELREQMIRGLGIPKEKFDE